MPDRKEHFSFFRYQLPVFVWAAVIYFFSSLPSRAFPVIDIAGLDKIVHGVFYFMLCVLTYRALTFQGRFPTLARHSLVFTFLFTVLYGFFDELHQLFVPGRSPEVFDLAADIAATLLGIGLILLLRRRERSS